MPRIGDSGIVASVDCAACGEPNEGNRKFCGECGAPLQRSCPSCGTANPPGVKFCGECGTPLAAQAGPASETAAAPQAERRLVSVLFADLVGFTAASEGRDAEDTRELLSRYFDTSRRLIELYGGTVEKFIGDAVMAVWGAPVATEDDAERAVRAALDLVAAVTSLGDEVGAPGLRARAGVLTGEAAVTLGASDEGMVAGDLVNTASRVQSAAEPGTVYVGESTRRATEQTIAFSEAGAFELKGKEGLTPLWQALRVVSGARGTLKSIGLEAPFVGRDGELRRIKDLFHTCAEEGRAHLVSVTGIAGIGKSRLAWEFYKYFDGLPQLTYWHRGRCLAYGDGVAYWALADMVRMRCRIAEDDDQDTARAKLREALEEHLPDESERTFVEPRLAQLLGLAEAESPDRQDLFAAWRLFFERLAEVYPTVLAFEDMQWADASLLDFVEHLLEWSRNHALYVITLARPELVERRPTWGAGQRHFTSIYLDPLPEQAMGELLDGLVPGLPAEAREQILARAEGVPLYAVETVRMLLDRGDLVQEGSVYRPVGEIGSLDVPETLHALIAARLDGLSSDERRLLQDGAVLGKTFTERALTALGSNGDIGSLLTALVRKEVLSLQTDPRSPEHGQYGFLQDLVRYVAYETLSRRERRTRHLAAAAYLEQTLSEDEVAEMIAAHYIAAYEAAPDSEGAGEIRARACDALARAGDRATAVAASAEAYRYFRRAAELADDPYGQASLLDRSGQAALRANLPAEGRELLERAHSLYSAQEPERAALVSARLAEVDFNEGHGSQAVARLESALEALAGAEPDAHVAAVAGQLGRFLVLSGHGDRAVPHIERALEMAERLDLPEVLSQALNTKGARAAGNGRLHEGRILLEGALAIALEHDIHAAALRAYNNLAWVLEMQDLPRESLVVCERGTEHARRVGDRGAEINFVLGSLSTRFLLGDWSDAQAHADGLAEAATTYQLQLLLLQAVDLFAARGDLAAARAWWERFTAGSDPEDPQAIMIVRATEAVLLRAEGKPREALAAAESAFGQRGTVGLSALMTKHAAGELLESALALGDIAKAEEVLAVLDGLRPGELSPLYRGLRARFRGRLAPGPAAAAHFREAEEVYESLGTPFLLAVTRLEHAEPLESSGRSDEAEALRAAARAVFERLGAKPWLERADRSTAGERPASVPA
jgi:class 3 adenylate cyclase/tetratricopeptide (TPR) repeat protein